MGWWGGRGWMPKYGPTRLVWNLVWGVLYFFFLCWKMVLEQEIKNKRYFYGTGGGEKVSRWSRNQNCCLKCSWWLQVSSRLKHLILYGNPILIFSSFFFASLLYLFTDFQNTHSLWLDIINAVFKCKSCLIGSSQNHVMSIIYLLYGGYTWLQVLQYFQEAVLATSMFQGRKEGDSTLCYRSLVWFCIVPQKMCI